MQKERKNRNALTNPLLIEIKKLNDIKESYSRMR